MARPDDSADRLAESAARVFALAAAGLGRPVPAALVYVMGPWRRVARAFLDQDDGDFAVKDLVLRAATQFALAAGLPADDAAFDAPLEPAWEAVVRHLCRWVNELAEGNLDGLEGSEAEWGEWARARAEGTCTRPA